LLFLTKHFRILRSSSKALAATSLSTLAVVPRFSWCRRCSAALAAAITPRRILAPWTGSPSAVQNALPADTSVQMALALDPVGRVGLSRGTARAAAFAGDGLRDPPDLHAGQETSSGAPHIQRKPGDGADLASHPCVAFTGLDVGRQ
jgi:hypothetical protein